MHAIHTARPTYLKTASSILFEFVFLASFFLLFCLEESARSASVLSPGLLVFYLIMIVAGAGMTGAFIAERKGKSMWAWGFNTSVSTIAIIIIVTLVFWVWIGYALIIAPIVAIPITAFLMDSEDK